ncbi:PLP-dependent lyase/thiolase, partial [Anaerosalibacter bizertensis]|nr:PLP-dependent lyase/thiolase [Anaerosalibacter bizertensis]
MTEALAQLEGLERGPAGNTSLAATFALAQELDEDKIIVAQETEYTGAGKHIQPQLTFAKENGIEIVIGDPKDEIPGENIVLPEDPSYIKTKDIDLNKIKRSYIRNCIKNTKVNSVTSEDIEFLVKDTKSSEEFVKKVLDE